MKPFGNYKAVPAKEREIIPAGGYVAEIKSAVEDHQDWGTRLLLLFEIAEGEHAGFFQKDYINQNQEDKKWRGIYRLNIPRDDGSERDQWTKNTFGRAMWSFEESNPGYHWDWDEAGLIGKKVGVLFRNKEWELNGRTGWTTECCALCSANDIRSETFNVPKDKPLANKAPESNLPQMDIGNDDLLPWS